MDKVPFNYSLKNIPIPNETAYLKTLIAKTEQFMQRLRWKVLFFLQKSDSDDSSSEDEDKTFGKYGFKTEHSAPQQKDLIKFENDLISAIANIKFSKHQSKEPFQTQLKNDIRKINNSKNLFVLADKTSNVYEVNPKTYNDLLHNSITNHYTKCATNVEDSINKQAAKITTRLGISERVEKLATKPAYITLKDHKDNFQNSPKCRLINPMKSNIGKISKIILQEVNAKIRAATHLNQWTSTDQVIQWFKNIDNTKKQIRFMQLDIVEFYPSITKKLYNDALEFASKMHYFSAIEKDALHNARLAILNNNNTNWQKKEKLFDTTMGAYDGAEVAELTGLFLLNKVAEEFNDINFGLYRDDGLGVHKKLPGPTATKMIKKITSLFKRYGLKITININLTIVDFLDITMNIMNKEFWPYRKPNSRIQYINTKSNHPQSVLKHIPETINKRLNNRACNETKFNNAKAEYQKALKESGHQHNLAYTENDEKKNNKRKRNIIWYNPPYNMAITTNFGRTFLDLIDKHFPRNHRLHKIINRKTVKLSYSCMGNMKSIILNHNKKIVNNAPQNHDKTCNCNKSNRPNCPLNGNCLQKCVIYQAKIDTVNKTAYYIGSTANTFKERFTQHKSSFKNENKKHSTLLSTFVWKENLNPNPKINWTILKTSHPYKPGSKLCHLCLDEKLSIVQNIGNTHFLNLKKEIGTRCPHRYKYTLAHLKGKHK